MIDSYETLNQVFQYRTTGPFKDKPYILHKPERGAEYTPISYAEFGERVRRQFGALRSLGIERGDRIAVLSESRVEWLENDFAALALGAITVPMFPTLTYQQVEYIVNDSGAKVLFVSNDLQLSKALKCIDGCPGLETIVVFNGSTRLTLPASRVNILFYPDIAGARDGFDASLSKAKPNDTITIIYTSGTTGTPKGVMLSHHNLLANIQGALQVLPTIDERDTALSFLPLCHAFERVAMYLFIYCGFTVAFAESIDTVAENMLEIRPTVMTGVPRFYERVYGRIMRMREKMPKSRRSIFDWAVRVGEANARSVEGKPVPLLARMQKPLADKLVLDKIRARTGGRIRFFVSGAAALPAEVGRAFTSFGLTLIEGYGMTECSPIISVNPYDKIRWGTVGHPLPNVEVKIAHDGEILTRGPNVMKGYYKDEAATRKIIDHDGWLATGDIGEFDHEGYLRITDRKKHLFVSSGGKNIAPAHIEALLEQSRYIAQIMLVGDKRQYCTALVVPDPEAFEAGVSESEMRRVIEVDLDRLQKELATYERVRKFALTEPFTVENGMMTPTLKIKRKEVERRYSETIDALYTLEKAQV